MKLQPKRSRIAGEIGSLGIWHTTRGEQGWTSVGVCVFHQASDWLFGWAGWGSAGKAFLVALWVICVNAR